MIAVHGLARAAAISLFAAASIVIAPGVAPAAPADLPTPVPAHFTLFPECTMFSVFPPMSHWEVWGFHTPLPC
ncbi:MAG: hypothetical protein EOP32_01555 [Rhodococcus sp. (in: high G+C Gram-positive bacteria)]|nr:MAG: hypothetical protein EOP32_01555 [Rhodococcus sp. (in: high G+C Gram-positive bacteria)]